ncbi:hypothetical protein JYK14_03910 [Siccirubricoccus sp. KC 17139]|uniref:Uncharacterized protein n=1 Tax=Siccirubricoccus soli TaxID=2899147 RepID=A0ABT1D0Y3_9PROT|nr:hypothetical protein [Siccirubricoccus soli]MCO6415322.1 hypothetical protein [Siccirubricoccus soli]MCP2681454.1 hypothetical protein [Siccirubricoccus soli]
MILCCRPGRDSDAEGHGGQGRHTYKVKSVSLKKDKSVNDYLRTDASKDGLQKVLDGLAATGDWTLAFDIQRKKKTDPPTARVNGFGYPDINKHPGHVHGKGWKYKVEGGKDANRSVDRLVVSDTKADITVKKQEAAALELEVDISCDLEVLQDTH